MESLIIRLQQGDKAAFRKIYDLFHTGLYRFCYKFLKDHQQTQEIVQETFLRFWVQYCNSTLRPDASIEPLLFTIARRMLVDNWRKQIALGRCKEQANYFTLKDTNDAEEITQSKELEQLYQSAFAQLNEQQQKIFVLSREEGLSYPEIAERMHISTHTVKYHISNALTVFRRYLAKHGILSSLMLLIKIF